MSRRFVDQLEDGENIDDVFLVTDKQLRTNKNGNLYIQVELRDRSASIIGRLWNANEPQFRSFEIGDFLLVKGKAQLFQGALQIILNTFEKIENKKVDLANFLPHTEHDVGKLFERLKTFLLKVSNPHLRALAECYLMDADFMNGICRAPAGVRVHHAYIGGLLEHLVTMMDVAERILPLYPDVDRDLVILGVFLHDSGKIRELTYDRAFGYSDEGQLIGHINIGVEMLEAKVAQVPDLTGEPMPRELLLRLKHLILSHHGTLEHGSPKIPMTPEAVALHAIDNLDTRIQICVREIKDNRGLSTWTQYNQALQRRLFIGGNGTSDSANSIDSD
ncbi:MAG: HD domain-containing protein [Planctomycetes bacterium]|nr:HD domain-containing protein [Planctomycetota bacterium]